MYYEKMADLATVADTTQVPLPFLLEDLAIGYIYRIKGNEVKAKMYESYLISENERVTPKGLIMLDKMDKAQGSVVGQPQSISKFRGQKAIQRFYGNSSPMSDDYRKENYF